MDSHETELEELRPRMEGNHHTTAVVGVSRRKLADSCFRAVAAGRFQQVKFLLDNGVAPATRNDNGQNLIVASLYIPDPDKRRRMVSYLLSRGVPCGGRDNSGRDALCWACILGLSAQMEQIAKAAIGNVDLQRQDNEGMTPLHHAVRNGHVDIVRILVTMMKKFRLSVDVPDVHGLTPYLYARRLGHYDVADVLVQEGSASKKQFDSQKFHSADDWAIIGAQERREREINAKERRLALYKIRGRLPPVHQNKTMTTKIQKAGIKNEDAESTPDVTSCSMDTAMALLRLHPNARNIPTVPIDNITDSSSHEHHHRNAPDTIPSIMEILADQRCPSYRPQAKVAPLPVHSFRRSMGKGKLSTLAILLNGKVGPANRRKSVAPH